MIPKAFWQQIGVPKLLTAVGMVFHVMLLKKEFLQSTFLTCDAPQIGNLSLLVSLDLSNNYFHATLPKDIGKILINFVCLVRFSLILSTL